jgi:catechol 2,3-dioxygenase-like lactoylglutathione lyase family enzyme
MRVVHTILYVSDQNRSTDFYGKILGADPVLNVPGMTEFRLSENHILGLMPETGIKNLLGPGVGEFAQGSLRAELYFRVSNPEELFTSALEHGAKELSPIARRDWGDRAGYVMDFDSNILAFAASESANLKK